MWIVFFFGLGELLNRYLEVRHEAEETRRNYLPEDEETVLVKKDLPEIYRRVRPGSRSRFLPRLVRRIIQQFQVSNSVDQANSLLNSSLDLFLHEIDLNYNMLRYIMWFIPTLGFIGTVIGIANAMEFAGDPANADSADLLYQVTSRLGVAFFTTLVALVMSGILVFLVHVVQAREETTLNAAGSYCLDNLINRLYEE